MNNTKDIIVDFRNNKPAVKNVDKFVINDYSVEIVKSYKYLGTQLDEKSNGSETVKMLYCKAVKRMHLVLKNLSVNNSILDLYYSSTV